MKSLYKIFLGFVGILLIIILALFVANRLQDSQEAPVELSLDETEIPTEVATQIEEKNDLIIVDEPQPFDEVASPVTILGKARGFWYFEGDFPVRIEDADGNVLGKWYASAQLNPDDPDSTWMTKDFVTFRSELSFASPTTTTGTLILERDNPSGLPENADELRLPVRFAAGDSNSVEPAENEVTREDEELVSALINFANQPGSEMFTEVSFTDEVSLGLSDEIVRSVPVMELKDHDAWLLDREEFRGWVGPFSALDLLSGVQGYQLSVGPHPHCASPPAPLPVGVADLRHISIQPDLPENSSCLEWWTVDLFVTSENEIQTVTLDLWEP